MAYIHSKPCLRGCHAGPVTAASQYDPDHAQTGSSTGPAGRSPEPDRVSALRLDFLYYCGTGLLAAGNGILEEKLEHAAEIDSECCIIYSVTDGDTRNKNKEETRMTNFDYMTPTRLIFGKDSIEKLPEVMEQFGKKVLLTYGGGSQKG